MKALISFLLGFILVFAFILNAYAEQIQIGWTTTKIWNSLTLEQKADVMTQLFYIGKESNCKSIYRISTKEKMYNNESMIYFYGECLDKKDNKII